MTEMTRMYPIVIWEPSYRATKTLMSEIYEHSNIFAIFHRDIHPVGGQPRLCIITYPPPAVLVNSWCAARCSFSSLCLVESTRSSACWRALHRPTLGQRKPHCDSRRSTPFQITSLFEKKSAWLCRHTTCKSNTPSQCTHIIIPMLLPALNSPNMFHK